MVKFIALHHIGRRLILQVRRTLRLTSEYSSSQKLYPFGGTVLGAIMQQDCALFFNDELPRGWETKDEPGFQHCTVSLRIEPPTLALSKGLAT